MECDQHDKVPTSPLFPPEVLDFANRAMDNGWYFDSHNNTVILFDQTTNTWNSASDNVWNQFLLQNLDQSSFGQDTNGKRGHNLTELFDGHPSGNEFESLASTSSSVAYPEEDDSSVFAQVATPIVGTEGELQNSWMGVVPPSYGCYGVDSDGDWNNCIAPPAVDNKELSMTGPNATPTVPDLMLSDLSQALALLQDEFDKIGLVASQPDLSSSCDEIEQRSAM